MSSDKRQRFQIIMCLSGSLLCLYISFLAMITLDREYRLDEADLVPCSVLAALIHFFLLSSLTWMGIEGFNTYLLVISIFKPYIPNYMLKAAFVGWGLPAIAVGVTGGIARREYAARDYCYIDNWSLLGGFLIPMSIILLLNIIVFILAICRLGQSARLARSQAHQTVEQERKAAMSRMQTGLTMLVMLGLTWSTGYLVLIGEDVAEVLFIIFNTLQGFFIFLLYGVRVSDVRALWRQWFYAPCGPHGFATAARSSLDTPVTIPLSSDEPHSG